MTARKIVWIVGWVIVALLVVTALLALFNTPASVHGAISSL